MFFIQTIKEKLMSKWITSLVKQGLTALGAVLVAAGIIEADQATQFVDTNVSVIVGAVLYGIGQLWDLVKK